MAQLTWTCFSSTVTGAVALTIGQVPEPVLPATSTGCLKQRQSPVKGKGWASQLLRLSILSETRGSPLVLCKLFPASCIFQPRLLQDPFSKDNNRKNEGKCVLLTEMEPTEFRP